MEDYHTILGRYEQQGQARITPGSIRSSVNLPDLGHYLEDISVSIKGEIVNFHCDIIPNISKPGDQPRNHGDCSYIDAASIVLLNERMNGTGCIVAQLKHMNGSVPTSIDDKIKLRESLTNEKREDRVKQNVRAQAEAMAKRPSYLGKDEKYAFEEVYGGEIEFPEFIVKTFDAIMEKTKDVEVIYLQELHRLIKNGTIKMG
ncbi:MAG: hypothetical protein ACREBF_00775 [Candidatus Micrarchaeales archaeon]